MFKKLIIFLIVAISSISYSFASHQLGGEITWECQPNGQFVFTMKLYRDCGGASLPTSAQNLSVTGAGAPVGNITLNYISTTDITPTTTTCSNPLSCTGATSGSGAMEEYLYVSNPVTLNGTPGAGGWTFSWSSCCRPSSLVYGANASYYLRAKMFAYNGQNTFPCFDSSPFFAERPTTVLCPGYAFSFNHLAVDNEIDSIQYDWDQALTAANTSVNYTFPYTFNNPVPGNPTLDPGTGVIVINNANTIGSFPTCVKVTAYKCQQKVAEIYRDIPIIFANCSPLPSGNPNQPPQVTISPIEPGDLFTGIPAGATNFTDTVVAGTFVQFDIQSTDFEFNQDGSAQLNILKPNGIQFGNQFFDQNNGCINAPCAYLGDGNNPPTLPIQATFGVQSRFNWQTDCSHLKSVSCSKLSSTYSFILKVEDDNCPAPGANYITVSITVIAPPPVESPQIRCANVLPNGDVDLTWSSPYDSTTLDTVSFYNYEIYASNNVNGPYTLVDSIFDPLQTNYTHTGAGANGGTVYYYMETRSECNGQRYSTTIDSIPRDTVATMYLNVNAISGGGVADLNWNHFTNPLLPTNYGWYYIWEEAPAGSNSWTLIDSVQTNTFQYPVTICWDSLAYKVETRDSAGCSSFSTLDGDWFGANTQPIAPLIDSVSVDNGTGDVNIAWQPSATSSVDWYYIYEVNGGVYTLIDSVQSPPGTTTYTHTGATPNANAENYAIVGIDTCGIVGDTSLIHNTMYVTVALPDSCVHEDTLTWNNYINWPAGVDHYDVFVSVNGGAYTLAGTNSGPNPDTTFINGNLTNGDNYCYYIRAYDGTGLTSTSNIVCYTATGLKPNTVVNPPELRCVSVQPNGDVTVNWLAPNDPDGTFTNYEIYHSNNPNGPYTLLSTIPTLVTTSMTHVGANANNVDNYYYAVSLSGCDGTVPSTESDTLQAIRLSVNVVGGIYGTLTWNPIHVPDLPTSTGTYTVYKEYPAGSGVYNPIGTTPYGTELMLDSMFICDDSARYYVEIGDQSGCTSVSSVSTGQYFDNTPPSPILVDSVTVDPFTGLASIGWSASNDGDVTWYYIFQLNPITGANDLIDSVQAGSPMFYTYLASNAANQSEQYAIGLTDSCGNQMITTLDYHNTIYLKADPDVCDASVTLTWNAYDDFASATNPQYRVYISTNGSPFTVLGTTTNTSYVHNGIVNGDVYQYYVRAYDNGGVGPFTSTSNLKQVDASLFADPAFNYMYFATVVDSQQIDLEFYADTAADVKEYVIKRALEDYHVFTTVGSEIAANSMNPLVHYSDYTAAPNNSDYYYKIYVINPCEEVKLISNVGRTMHLTVTPNKLEMTNTLVWNEYEDWAGGVQQYEIYRSVDEYWNPVPIDTIAAVAGLITYVDDVSDQLNGMGEFCYKIKAIENPFPHVGGLPSTVSYSNEVCVYHDPYFYIPNAFNPGGINNSEFMPVLRFADPLAYEFLIFDRWGHQVFNTNDINEGWNGKMNNSGDYLPTGVYVYLIRYQSATGEDYEVRGTVTIIR